MIVYNYTMTYAINFRVMELNKLPSLGTSNSMTSYSLACNIFFLLTFCLLFQYLYFIYLKKLTSLYFILFINTHIDKIYNCIHHDFVTVFQISVFLSVLLGSLLQREVEEDVCTTLRRIRT